ncbi:MAG: glycosyltransferase [Leptolyngbya sp. SIO4C1]|nr:glycosyltransferase [Leptolyngbya sp. SIO4C1]
MLPTFSVVTPSFQQGQFIERTIQSVVAQDYSNFEYVVCDGGSRDRTIEILEQYTQHLRWISEPDQGQAHAVNKGIALTTGEIIAWINSDDIYYPQAFRQVATFFIEHPDTLAVYGQADWIDVSDHAVAAYPTQPWSYSQLTKECYLCQPAVFFKRDLVRQAGGLNNALQYCMDYELWLRYGQFTSFGYIPTKLAASRIYSQNKTFSDRLKVHHEVNYMQKEILGYSTKNWIFEYSKLKSEQSAQTKLQRSLFLLTFLRISIQSCWIFNKAIAPIILAKVLINCLFKKDSHLSQENTSRILEFISDSHHKH